MHPTEDMKSLLSAVKDSISQLVLDEAQSLRFLIECTSKDIEMRLLKLEGRLQSACGHHLSQNKSDDNGETKNEKIPDKCIKFITTLPETDSDLENEQATPKNATSTGETASPQRFHGMATGTEASLLEPSVSVTRVTAEVTFERISALMDVESSITKKTLDAGKGFKTIVAGVLREGDSLVIYDKRDVARKVPNCFTGVCKSIPCIDKTIQSVLRSVFGISDPNIWVGHPGSSLIHPNSPFSTGAFPRHVPLFSHFSDPNLLIRPVTRAQSRTHGPHPPFSWKEVSSRWGVALWPELTQERKLYPPGTGSQFDSQGGPSGFKNPTRARKHSSFFTCAEAALKRLLEPNSNPPAGLECVAALLLFYCVGVVPIQLSFWST
jgi:hypothetical protein